MADANSRWRWAVVTLALGLCLPARPLAAGEVGYPLLAKALPGPAFTAWVAVERAGLGASLPASALKRLARAAWVRAGGQAATSSTTLSPYFIRAALTGGGLTVVAESDRLAPAAPDETVVAVERRLGRAPSAADFGRLLAALPPVGQETDLSYVLAGRWSGRLDARAEAHLGAVILSTLGASLVAQAPGRGVWSLWALAPGLGPAVWSGGRRVNLQLLLAYDRQRHEADVWLGTPSVPISPAAWTRGP
jgi:hypothetical protein